MVDTRAGQAIWWPSLSMAPILIGPPLVPPQGFTSCFQRHDEVLTELEKATKRLKKLEAVYREFELQKVCYLPLNAFLLKPIQRLLHYRLLLGRLCTHYGPAHPDHADCHGERGARPRRQEPLGLRGWGLCPWGGQGVQHQPGWAWGAQCWSLLPAVLQQVVGGSCGGSLFGLHICGVGRDSCHLGRSTLALRDAPNPA